MISNLAADIRLAARGFLKNPSFCIVAILTIALGIGANTAVFGLAQKLLLETLPVVHPEQLVELDCIDRTNPEEGQCDASWPGFHIYEENAPLLSGLFAYSAIADINVIHNGEARLARPLLASGNMYDVFGIAPLQGRLLNKNDDAGGLAPVAVLSYEFWNNAFGADTAIVGKSLRMNSHPVTIVGVTPAGFRGIALGEPPDITFPMGSTADLFLRPGTLASGTNWWLKIIGRRKDGVSIEQLQTALAPVFGRTVEHMIAAAGPDDGPKYRETLKNYEFRVRPAAAGGFSELRSDLRLPLRVLLVLVAIVLLVACANLAGLFLSRTAARRHEIAVRFCLGASRMRLARQFWTESLMLSAIGGALGLVLARWSGPLLLKLASGEQALRSVDLSPTPGIFLFAAAAVALTGLLIGIGPVLGISVTPAEAVRSVRASRKTSGLTRLLVPAQVTLATLLLIGAGLFMRTLGNLRQVNLGYRYEQLVTLTTSPDLAGYDESRRKGYWNEMIGRITALPGVASATLSGEPIGKLNNTTAIKVPGFETSSPRDQATGQKRVGARFVETAGMTLLKGNDFSPADVSSARRIVIVNASFAQHFFRSIDIVGHQFAFNVGRTQVPLEIVGVVADAHDRGPKMANERVMYVLSPQMAGTAAIGVRTTSSPASMVAAIRSTVRAIDPNVPIREIRTLDDQLNETLGRDRLLATLGAFFGSLALLLVAIGLYGLMASNVGRRTREIGIRIALGAQKANILWLVLGEGLLTTAIGAALGLAVGMMSTRYVQSALFGIQPNDPLTLAAVTLSLVLVAVVASLIPARRASRIALAITLSNE